MMVMRGVVLMEILVLVVTLAMLDVLALRYGVDSRPGFTTLDSPKLR